MDYVLAPSVLSADFSDIKSGLATIEKAQAKWIHLDVMDGHFVPPLTFGSKMIADLRKETNLFLDVHLMIDNPEMQIDNFLKTKANAYTFHYEACVHHHRLISHIHQNGFQAGISIVPSTSVSVLKEILPYVDIVLVMTVNPGYGGQRFIDSCVDKIAELNDLRKKHNYNYRISIDGGVGKNNIDFLKEKGADTFVSGTAFFKDADPVSFAKYFQT